MPQYAMAMFGSSVTACRNERSDSRNQNECTCETPWLKNFRASSEDVVTGMLVTPIPSIRCAGRSGCAPGGTAHISASGRTWAEADVAARSRAALAKRKMVLMSGEYRPSAGGELSIQYHRQT